MPYIGTTTNMTLTNAQKESVAKKYGKAIAQIPGKSESKLMVIIEDERYIYFKGAQVPGVAYVDVKLFGKAEKEAYDNLTDAISEVLHSELGIESTNIYVTYQEFANWGKMHTTL